MKIYFIQDQDQPVHFCCTAKNMNEAIIKLAKATVKAREILDERHYRLDGVKRSTETLEEVIAAIKDYNMLEEHDDGWFYEYGIA